MPGLADSPHRYGWLLALVLLVGAAVRALYMLAPPFDSDVSVVGLMGMHVLDGEFSPLFWGQHYGGSLESFLAAGLFSVFGKSVYVLDAVPALVSLVQLVLLYLLGRDLFGRRVGLIAAGLAALGPFLLVANSVSARGINIETLTLGTLILWITVRMLKAGPDHPRQVWYCLAYGITAGVGTWTHALFLYFLPPTFLMLWWADPRLVLRPRFALLFLAFLLGVSPFVIHNIQTHGGTLYYMSHPRPNSGFLNNLWIYLSRGLPVIGGVLDAWGKVWQVPVLAQVVLFFSVAVWLTALGGWAKNLWLRLTKSPQADGSETLVLTFVCTAVVFSGVGGADSGSFRYLLSLFAIWPLAVGYFFKTVSARGKWGGRAAGLIVLSMAVLNLTGSVINSPAWNKDQRDIWANLNKVHEELAGFMNSHKLRYAYVSNYWLGMRGTFLTREKIILIPFFKERHPPYRQALLRSDRFAYAMDGESNTKRIKEALTALHADFKVAKVQNFWVFYDIKAPAYAVRTLSPLGLRVSGASAYPAASTIWDQNANTRWSTEAAQKPGQFIELDLGRETPDVCQVLVFSGSLQDMPDRLEIKASLDHVHWETLAKNSCPIPFFWSGGKPVSLNFVPWQEFRFAPHAARYIRLEQKGKRKVFWWSVLEVVVGQKAGASPLDDPASAAKIFVQTTGHGPIWAEPGLRAWLPESRQASINMGKRPKWLREYLLPEQLMPSKGLMQIAVRDQFLDQARQVLGRGGYQWQEKSAGGYTLLSARPKKEAAWPAPIIRGLRSKKTGQTLRFDLGKAQSVGGLVVNWDWPSQLTAFNLRVAGSLDGAAFQSMAYEARLPRELYWSGLMPLAVRKGPLRLKFAPRRVRYLEMRVVPAEPKAADGPIRLDVYPPSGKG